MTYVVMIADRHTDPEPVLFAEQDAAIDYARQVAHDRLANGEVEEEDVPGWLYCASWSSEGDSVWVVERPTIFRALNGASQT